MVEWILKTACPAPKSLILPDCRLAEGGTPISRIDIDSPCIPVSCRDDALVDSDGKEDISVLREVDLGPSKYASLDGPVGGHSMDSVESRLTTKFFR